MEGDRVPVRTFADELRTAARRARTGSGTFVYEGEEPVEFTIREPNVDVRLGSSVTGWDRERRVVGDRCYVLADAATSRWTYWDLNDSDPLWAHALKVMRLSRHRANPIGLIESMYGEAEVLSVEAGLSTLRVPTDARALLRAQGDLSSEDEAPVVVPALWTVGDDDLVQEVRQEGDTLGPIRFFAWGTTPEVTAPGGDNIVSQKDLI